MSETVFRSEEAGFQERLLRALFFEWGNLGDDTRASIIKRAAGFKRGYAGPLAKPVPAEEIERYVKRNAEGS